MDKETYQSLISNKIWNLELGTSLSRAALADLKRSLGRGIENVPDLWKFIYDEYTLDKWQEKSSNSSQIENSLVDVLSLYSLHTRNNISPHDSSYDATFPKFLKSMRANSANQDSFDNKVGRLLSSTDYDHAIRAISHLISGSKSVTTNLNYAVFGWELFLLNTSSRKTVLYSWGRNYFAKTAKPVPVKSTVITATKEAVTITSSTSN